MSVAVCPPSLLMLCLHRAGEQHWVLEPGVLTAVRQSPGWEPGVVRGVASSSQHGDKRWGHSEDGRELCLPRPREDF